MYVITYIYDILIFPNSFGDMVILAEIFGDIVISRPLLGWGGWGPVMIIFFLMRSTQAKCPGEKKTRETP